MSNPLQKFLDFHSGWNALHDQLSGTSSTTESLKRKTSPKLNSRLSPEPTSKSTSTSKKKSTVPPGLRYEVLKRDGGRCVLCGNSKKEGVKLHVDHIVPRSKGGKDTLDNLQTLCQPCNLGKGNRDNRNWRI
jgi:5-methylcytosine-specific restriction endonuclease McrA